MNIHNPHLLLHAIISKHEFEQEVRQLSEEYGELIQAINKFIRYDLGDDPKAFKVTNSGRINHIAEEIADMELVLRQLTIMLECEYNVASHYQAKLEREYDRVCGTTSDKP